MQLSEMRGVGKVEDLGQQWRQLKSEKKRVRKIGDV